MDWNNYFTMISDWKKLPAYRAEPRIDSLIGYYLTDIVGDFLQKSITGIIPELPIRLGTVKQKYKETNLADRSYKVDFYLLDSLGTNYFVEFKSDSGSRRPKQDLYLNEAKNIGMESIIEGILQIANVSSYKDKYTHLIKKLTELKLINANKHFGGKSTNIEIIYVQPHKTIGDMCIDFKCIAEWMTKKYENNEFEQEFAKKLFEWSGD
jgi:hypothetical protein